VFLLGCSGDSSTGSLVFAAKDLVLLGNPSIIGESSGTEANPSGFINLGGVFESNSGLALSGLKVRARLMDANGVEIGQREGPCTPESIGAGGTCTFLLAVPVTGFAYSDVQLIEITPISDQGTGTSWTSSVTWPEA
jgi:hypothetical protein